MATFRKFAFPSQKIAEELLQKLQPLDNAVNLGELGGSICFDILFNENYPESLEPYIVWPKSCGVHSFAGWEDQYLIDWETFTNESKQEAE